MSDSTPPDQPAPKPTPKSTPKRLGTRVRIDWNVIAGEFFRSPFASFIDFLRESGYAEHLSREPQAQGMAEAKKKLEAEVTARVLAQELSEPVKRLQAERLKVRQRIMDRAGQIDSAVQRRLAADGIRMNMAENESPQAWAARMDREDNFSKLTENDLMCLAGAAKVAADLMRAATGIDDLTLQEETGLMKRAEKEVRTLNIRVVRTVNAREINQLTYAEGHEPKAAGDEQK